MSKGRGSPTENKEQKKDGRKNFSQIFRHYETVYVVKLFMYSVMIGVVNKDLSDAYTMFVEGSLKGNPHHMAVSLTTLVVATLLDSVALCVNCKLKSELGRNIQYLYMLLLGAFFAFLALIFFDVIAIEKDVIEICKMIGVGCCVSPMFELIFDLSYRIQDERDKGI